MAQKKHTGWERKRKRLIQVKILLSAEAREVKNASKQK